MGSGVGNRMKLAYTRAIIDAIRDGRLTDVPVTKDPIFGFDVVATCPGMPGEMLLPAKRGRTKPPTTQPLRN